MVFNIFFDQNGYQALIQTNEFIVIFIEIKKIIK